MCPAAGRRDNPAAALAAGSLAPRSRQTSCRFTPVSPDLAICVTLHGFTRLRANLPCVTRPCAVSPRSRQTSQYFTLPCMVSPDFVQIYLVSPDLAIFYPDGFTRFRANLPCVTRPSNISPWSHQTRAISLQSHQTSCDYTPVSAALVCTKSELHILWSCACL